MSRRTPPSADQRAQHHEDHDRAHDGKHRIDSAWALPMSESGTPRTPQDSPLSLARITSTAVAILDAEGTAERLTMRRLAADLGVTAAAMYWHVRTRNDVLDHALDAVFADVPLPAAATPWKQAVTDLMVGWRRIMLAHPWSPPLAGRPLLGPNVVLRIEALQAALVRGGLEGFGLAAGTRLLADFVVGSALTESAARQSDRAALRRAAAERLAGSPDLYPTLQASGHLDQEQVDDEVLFHAVLQRLITALPHRAWKS